MSLDQLVSRAFESPMLSAAIAAGFFLFLLILLFGFTRGGKKKTGAANHKVNNEDAPFRASVAAADENASDSSKDVGRFKIEIRWRSTFGVGVPLPVEEGMLGLEPEYILEAIAAPLSLGDDDQRFRIVAMRIKDEEGKTAFEGEVDSHGTLSTEEDSFLGIVSPLMNIEDGELRYEAADLLDNLSIFPDPSDVGGHIRIPHLAGVGHAIDMSNVDKDIVERIFFHAVRTTSILEPGISLTEEASIWPQLASGSQDQSVSSELTVSFALMRLSQAAVPEDGRLGEPEEVGNRYQLTETLTTEVETTALCDWLFNEHGVSVDDLDVQPSTQSESGCFVRYDWPIYRDEATGIELKLHVGAMDGAFIRFSATGKSFEFLADRDYEGKARQIIEDEPFKGKLNLDIDEIIPGLDQPRAFNLWTTVGFEGVDLNSVTEDDFLHFRQLLNEVFDDFKKLSAQYFSVLPDEPFQAVGVGTG